jgi:lysylphosphatidylglycerol synthetase-like protein (DUF2156 family)
MPGGLPGGPGGTTGSVPPGQLPTKATPPGELPGVPGGTTGSIPPGQLPTNATPPGTPSGLLNTIPPDRLPFSLHGAIHLMPLGISLVGAVVLGALLLRHGRTGLPVRAAAAAVAFPAGLAAVALAARGHLTLQPPAGSGASGCGPDLPFRGALPGSLSAAFGVDLAPTAAAAAIGVLAVAGVCWAALRFRAFAAGLRGALIAVGALTAVCLLAAGFLGGGQLAGGVLLVLPQVLSLFLLRGLGVPVTLPCGAGLPPTWVAAIVLLGCGIVVAARTRHLRGGPPRRAAVVAVRLASVLGVVFAVLALLSGVSLELGIAVVSFPIPVLAVNPLLALVAGLAGGAPAGFAGSLLADGFRSLVSVSSRTWKR